MKSKNLFIILTLVVVILLIIAWYVELQRTDISGLKIEISDYNAKIRSGDFVWIDGSDMDMKLINPTHAPFKNVTVHYSIFDMDSEYPHTAITYGVIPSYYDIDRGRFFYLKNVVIPPHTSYRFTINTPCYCESNKSKPIYRTISTEECSESWYYCKYDDGSRFDICQYKEDFVECEESCLIGQGEYVISVLVRDEHSAFSEKFYVFVKETSTWTDTWHTEPPREGGLFEEVEK